MADMPSTQSARGCTAPPVVLPHWQIEAFRWWFVASPDAEESRAIEREARRV